MNTVHFFYIMFLLCISITPVICMEENNEDKKLLSYEEFITIRDEASKALPLPGHRMMVAGNSIYYGNSSNLDAHYKYNGYIAQLALITDMPNQKKNYRI